MAVGRDGRFVSGRTHPRLLLVAVTPQPAPSGSSDSSREVFEFRCPDADAAPLTVDPAALEDAPRTKIRSGALPHERRSVLATGGFLGLFQYLFLYLFLATPSRSIPVVGNAV